MKRIGQQEWPAISWRAADDLLAESGQAALVLDLTDLAAMGDDALAALETWCRQQPCPVIGLGAEASAAARCADAVVESPQELALMLQRIAAQPQAATVLVQVLRTIESLPVPEALTVESLAYATLQTGEEHQRWLRQRATPAPVAQDEGPALLSSREDGVLRLVLNRPASDNAYSVELRDALVEACTLVALDASIRQVKVTARGRCFCSGGALAEFGQVPSPADGHLIRSRLSPARLILSSPERYHFHVHTACIGSGIEIPACAGYLTAASRTLFWLPELAMGLIPGAGGCVSISRRIGRRRTAYLVLMNKKIDARKALAWGLIDAIVD